MHPWILALIMAPVDERPELFVDLADIDPTIQIDMRYAGERNFVGRPIEGYQTGRCLLTRPAAEGLAEVQRGLKADGLGLLVHDCYRPQRAVDDFAAWAKGPSTEMKKYFFPKVEKDRLFALQYIAHRSGHSRGSTVDLTLVALDEGPNGDTALADCAVPPGEGPTGLNMGTPWDCFSEASATASKAISSAARHRRRKLLRAMREAGFRNYAKEWWHYTLRKEPFPKTYFDFPVR